MAHFAKLDSNNIVLQVVVVSNSDAPTEADGIAKLQSMAIGKDDNGNLINFVQTSYNTYVDVADGVSKHKLGGTPFRRKYADIGDTWDAVNQQFLEPS
mgnify:CR=1 FL=1|tara:strand:- start:784 stop:1077 length:294 start_codon:yes stop_codon:yes gene_type:complete